MNTISMIIGFLLATIITLGASADPADAVTRHIAVAFER